MVWGGSSRAGKSSLAVIPTSTALRYDVGLWSGEASGFNGRRWQFMSFISAHFMEWERIIDG